MASSTYVLNSNWVSKLDANYYSAQSSYVLSGLISHHSTSRSLRSSDQNLLHQPRVRAVAGSRAFSSSAPKIWNYLPSPIRASTSIHTFKDQLKTLFFISFSVSHSPPESSTSKNPLHPALRSVGEDLAASTTFLKIGY
jgi:hypothetical protein